jgi:ABC-type Na+ efflux pump permease subunit
MAVGFDRDYWVAEALLPLPLDLFRLRPLKHLGDDSRNMILIFGRAVAVLVLFAAAALAALVPSLTFSIHTTER